MRVINTNQRPNLIRHLVRASIEAHPQFMPLHLSPYGQKHGRFHGDDNVTSLAIVQFLTIPLSMALSDADQGLVIRETFAFWQEEMKEVS